MRLKEKKKGASMTQLIKFSSYVHPSCFLKNIYKKMNASNILAFMIDFSPIEIQPPEPPASALVSLENSRYGFSFVDLGLTEEDLRFFHSLTISHGCHYNQFGNLAETEARISSFLHEMGENEDAVVIYVAKKLDQFVQTLVAASGWETAWIYLRATKSPSEPTLPYWNMDGHYYVAGRDGVQCRFVLTLLGPS